VSRSSDVALAGLALLIAAAPGCTRHAPAKLSMRVGHHLVRCVPPAGWEHLDHGRKQVFRREEMEIFLADLGPANREGLERELEAARRIAEAGRVLDAFERVRELEGPPLFLASWQQRAEFWRVWNGVVLYGDRAGRAAIEGGFESLLAGAALLPAVTPDGLVAYALHRVTETPRRELAHKARRAVGGREWIDVETWDRVTHLERRRLACVDDHGYLLVLGIERGPIVLTAPVYEALLGSIEIAADTTAVAQGSKPE
jgi:hypothetical protein